MLPLCMGIESLILKRVARVNRNTLLNASLDALAPTDSGGLHFLLTVTTRRARTMEQIFIPAVLRPALEKEKPNQVLDNKFRL